MDLFVFEYGLKNEMVCDLVDVVLDFYKYVFVVLKYGGFSGIEVILKDFIFNIKRGMFLLFNLFDVVIWIEMISVSVDCEKVWLNVR